MRILIVDNDEMFAHMLADRLDNIELAFVPVTVFSAEAARQAVAEADTPFDVFLLDQRLDGSDVDGVTLFQELKAMSPQSDAIVLTGYDDLEAGLRAFDVGAYRHLTKPFDVRELVMILRSLEKVRRVHGERNWLAALAEVSKDLQGGATMEEVGQIIVKAAPKLGFERARLWVLDEEAQMLKGLCQKGNVGLEKFTRFRYTLTEMPYSQEALAKGQTVIFKGNEHGPSRLEQDYAHKGFHTAVGERIKVPLLVGEYKLGVLTLDNAERPQTYTEEQREMLQLFGSQAASALERAQQQEETQLLLEIDEEITKQVARRDRDAKPEAMLDAMLDALRNHVGKVMAAENFMVVLHDQDSKHLDFRRQYEGGVLQPRHWRPYPMGLSGEVISKARPLLLPKGGEAYRRERGIPLFGKQSCSWLGAPLCIDGKAYGAVIVQDYEHEFVYGERERRLLSAVAKQVAGTVWMSYKDEEKDRDGVYKDSHALLRNRMRWLAEINEDWFWHAVLTIITHRDGLSFNRAVLFWLDEAGGWMRGRMGIGYFRHQETCDAWQESEKASDSFEKYLSKPEAAYAMPTPLQEQSAKWRLQCDGFDSPIAGVLDRGTRKELSSSKLRDYLPDILLTPTDSSEDEPTFQFALVPVKSGTRLLGLMVVDNFTDGEPLRPSDLDRLEELLSEAVVVWERAIETAQMQRLGESYKDVLSLNQEIMGKAAGGGELKEILQDLVQQARRIAGANCVVMYPYRASSDSYDLDLVSNSEGLLQLKEFQSKTKNKLRQQGVTFAILRSGVLVVPDIEKTDMSFGGKRLAEHDFLRREKIKALIGVPMLTSSGETLGVLYFDYRSPRRFSEQEIVRAEQIANIGANVISYWRGMEQEVQGRKASEAEEQLRQRAMQAFRNIQTMALSPDSDETKIVRAVVQNAVNLFERSVDVTLSMLSWEARGEKPERIRYDYHLGSLGRLTKRHVEECLGLVGEVIQIAMENPKSTPWRSHRNHLAHAIRFGHQPIGAFLVKKSSKQDIFSSTEIDIIEQLATVAALALDNVQGRLHLQAVASTIRTVTDPRGLEDTLKAVIAAARAVAPDLDCATLWYQAPNQGGKLVPGPQWGVLHDEHRRENAATDKLVRNVMGRKYPLFAPVVEREAILLGSFTQKEGIISTAAFPLRFGQKSDAFGALFLDYRTPHEFTTRERILFPIFADAAATAIHMAQAIELAERREKHLDAALKIVNAASKHWQREKVLPTILNALRDHFGEDSASYLLRYDAEDKVLELPEEVRDFYPPAIGRSDPVRLALDAKRIICQVTLGWLNGEERGVVNIPDVTDVSRYGGYEHPDPQTRSELCTGLWRERELLGVLVLKSVRVNAFLPEDEQLFALVAEQVAVVIDRIERSAQLSSSKRRQTVMAWQSEIAHAMKDTPQVLESVRSWFELRQPSVVGADDCRSLLEKHASMLREMLNAQVPTLEVVSLDELFTEIKEWISDKEDQWPELPIEYLPHRPGLMLYGDRRLLRRSLQNLVINAVEAMTINGKVEGKITLLSREYIESRVIEIEVRDTGPGIPAEDRLRVGIDLWPSKKGANRGTGLYKTALFMEMMDGGLNLLPDLPNAKGARLSLRVRSAQAAEQSI